MAVSSPVSLPAWVKDLIDTPIFVILTTLNPDGGPQSSVVWLTCEGDDLVFSTVRGRRKTLNMERDPRVAVCAYDPANPYRYFEVRGTVELSEVGGRELIDRLSNAYVGHDYASEEAVRVVCRVTATKVVTRGA